MRIAVTFLAILSLTLLLLLGLFHTDFGAGLGQWLLPQSFWLRFHQIIGTANAEQGNDAELALWVLLCAGLASIIVTVASLLYRRWAR
jgi:hypothetical protein